MVEGARLESVYTRKGIEGSNPFLSAFCKKVSSSTTACRCSNKQAVCIVARVSEAMNFLYQQSL